MGWTPELIGTLTAALMAMAAALNKYTIKLPVTRNGASGFNLKDCFARHEAVNREMASFREQQRVHIEKHRETDKKLDHGEHEFKDIFKEIQTITMNVGRLDTKIEERDRRNMDVIKENAEVMRKVLARLP